MRALDLLRLRERITASLWFIPAIAAGLAFGAAQVLVLIDRDLDPERQSWFLFGGASESARELLSTIASSMITFTALVFSITILVLQLASSQFSPRVLRTFLRDRSTQLTMGAFVGTFVYALALLPKIRASAEDVDGFVPALAMFVGFVLVLVSVGVFIHFIHHMANAIRAVTIIKRISAETGAALAEMYPDQVLEDADVPVPRPAGAPTAEITHQDPGGVLGAVDEERLLALACEAGCTIELMLMPGDFVPRGGLLFRIWSARPLEAADVRGALLISDERTAEQDPLFGFRQLVDIAERALSPGINDPSTAVQVLDELHELLRMLAGRQFPAPERVDERHQLRLILPRPSWNEYVRLALDEIRHYGGGSVQIARRMRALIEDCLTVARADRRAILEEELRMLSASVRRDLGMLADQAIASTPSTQGHGPA